MCFLGSLIYDKLVIYVLFKIDSVREEIVYFWLYILEYLNYRKFIDLDKKYLERMDEIKFFKKLRWVSGLWW